MTFGFRAVILMIMYYLQAPGQNERRAGVAANARLFR
jgi:hypothetical protein